MAFSFSFDSAGCANCAPFFRQSAACCSLAEGTTEEVRVNRHVDGVHGVLAPTPPLVPGGSGPGAGRAQGEAGARSSEPRTDGRVARRSNRSADGGPVVGVS